MSNLFKDMLKSGESLFLNELALDYEFLPKLLPYRENEQHNVARCIQPLLQERNGKNVLIHGTPGIGKTAAIKFVLRDLEDESDDVIPLYVNCWQKNTTYKIIVELCDQLGYALTHNKKTDELFEIVKNIVNKKAAVFVFDEIDKADDFDFLYSLLEGIYKKTIILVTNYKEWLIELDERIKSRLLPELIQFRNYNPAETKGIMKQRLGYAFVPGVWQDDAFEIAAAKASDLQDIRTGLYLLRESGNAAEDRASKKIERIDVELAIKKLDEFSTKKTNELEDDTKPILEIIKEHTGKKIGDIFKAYQAKGGQATYKTFQRRVRKLADNRFISAKKITGGSEGTTTILSIDSTKKLSDF